MPRSCSKRCFSDEVRPKHVFTLPTWSLKCVGTVRKSRGYQHVDRLLNRFHLPGRQIIWLKIPDEASFRMARRCVREAAQAAANRHGKCIFSWVCSKVRFTPAASKRFIDRRNMVRAARSIDVMDICSMNPLSLEGLQRALNVKLLHGNWGICDRASVPTAYSNLYRDLRQWCHQRHIPKPSRLRSLQTLGEACRLSSASCGGVSRPS